jgi:hypothetical protein
MAIDEKLVDNLKCLLELGGHVEFEGQGRIVTGGRIDDM